MKLVLFSYVWPEPESSAAGVRTLALIRGFQKEGWALTVLSPCAANPARARLESLGVRCHEVSANDSSIQELLKTLAPDTVIFDRFVLEEQFGFHVREACPNAARVIDTQDLHFLRHSRQMALEKESSLEALAQGDFAWDEKAVLRECASIFRSDLTLLLSSFEKNLLTERFNIPAELLELATISVSETVAQLPNFTNRKDFVFIGNFRHPPNHDGVFWFTREIWPKVRERIPQAELHLYGAYPPKEISSLENPARGIRFFGPADNAQRTLARYRVNLAPLRFGAGIKGKIADGWAAGIPAVSTSIGAESMGEASSWGGLLADSTEAFAEACVALYSEESLWQKSSDQGTKILRKLFNAEENSVQLNERLKDLNQSLAAVRERNLMGRILWREEARSTEYFSRWIEEKNKTSVAGPLRKESLGGGLNQPHSEGHSAF